MANDQGDNQGKGKMELRTKRIELLLRCRRAKLIRGCANDIQRSRSRFFFFGCLAIVAYAVLTVTLSAKGMSCMSYLASGSPIVVGSNSEIQSPPEAHFASAILWPTTFFLVSVLASWAAIIISHQVCLFRLLRED
jgi:hypothetical protein